MKKFLAFLLAALIVIGTWLLMKKQAQPSTTASQSVKTLLGMRADTEIKKPAVIADPDANKEEEEVYVKPAVVDEPTPMPDTPATGSDNNQPTVNNGEPIKSLEAQQAENAKANANTNSGAQQPTTDNGQPSVDPDAGLTPLQKAIKARNTIK